MITLDLDDDDLPDAVEVQDDGCVMDWKGSRICAAFRSRQARSSALQESKPFLDFDERAAALRTIDPRIPTIASMQAGRSRY
jgi:hypothetical protein